MQSGAPRGGSGEEPGDRASLGPRVPMLTPVASRFCQSRDVRKRSQDATHTLPEEAKTQSQPTAVPGHRPGGSGVVTPQSSHPSEEDVACTHGDLPAA